MMFRKRYPFSRQLDSMDCGPACLQMVAKHHGCDFSLEELRQQTYLTPSGTTLLNLNHAAESIGFEALSVELSFDKLVAHAPLPCIAHWDRKHFVVVYQASSKKILIADPSKGLYSVNREKFSEHWLRNSGLGAVLILQPTDKFRTRHREVSKSKIGTAASLVVNNKRHFFYLICCLGAASLLQLIFPFLTQAIIDEGINKKDVGILSLILAGQLTLVIGRTSIDFTRRWILLYLSSRINISTVSGFLNKLLRLPVRYFEQKPIGDFLRRIEDHSRVERFLTSSSLNFLFGIVNLAVFGIVLILYDWRLFSVFVIGSSIHIGFVLMLLHRRKSLDMRRFNHLASSQSSVIEMIEGVRDIKVSNLEKEKVDKWEHEQAKLLDIHKDTMKLTQIQEGGGQLINELKNVAITFVSATAVINGDITLGMMLSVQFIAGQLNGPLGEFISFARELHDAQISIARIRELEQIRSEQSPADTTKKHFSSDTIRSIRFSNVSFSYKGPHELPTLDDVSITIPQGKITAIVGQSGSGKSTILKMLLKFQRPAEGHILINEKDLNDIDTEQWRSGFAVVMQDGYIFNDTVAANITMHTGKMDKERLKLAIDLAELQEFVSQLPDGVHSILETRGQSISQGQKQRILIARAIYKDAPLLFLDEVTASLDPISESLITKNLRSFSAGRTVVAIAHRLHTIVNADQIIVLKRGRVAAIGSHDQLKASSEEYNTLINSYAMSY